MIQLQNKTKDHFVSALEFLGNIRRESKAEKDMSEIRT